jgi:hypothetical protein
MSLESLGAATHLARLTRPAFEEERMSNGALFKHMVDLAEKVCAHAGRKEITPQDLTTAAQVMSLPQRETGASLAALVREYNSLYTGVQPEELFNPDNEQEPAIMSNILDQQLSEVKATVGFTPVPREKWSDNELFYMGNAPTLFRTSAAEPKANVGVSNTMRSIVRVLGLVSEPPPEPTTTTNGENGGGGVTANGEASANGEEADGSSDRTRYTTSTQSGSEKVGTGKTSRGPEKPKSD